MAFFKFRKRGDEPVTAPAPAQSVETMRRRARHRLIGAAVLVLVGVIGFSLLFDTQPRPVSVDIPITIPDKDKVKPLAPPPAAATAAAPVVPAAPVTAVPASASLSAREEVLAPPTPAPAPQTQKYDKKPASTLVQPGSDATKTVAKSEPRPTPSAQVREDDGAKARALLDGKDAAADTGRFVVQIGAFADAAKLREIRRKLEKAGFKTYTQVVDTDDGKRTRVRLGPFPSRAEADKAATKVKALDLSTVVLNLS